MRTAGLSQSGSIVISPSSDSAILSNTESRLGGIEVQRRSLVVDQQLAGKGEAEGLLPADSHRRQRVGFVGQPEPVPSVVVLQRGTLLVTQKVQIPRHRAAGYAKLLHEVAAVGKIPALRAFAHHLNDAPDAVILRSGTCLHFLKTFFRGVPLDDFTLGIPKMLRPYFRYDRSLLKDLCRIAHQCLLEFMQTTLGLPGGIPGIVMTIHTFGEYLDFHPSPAHVARGRLVRTFGSFLPTARCQPQAVGRAVPGPRDHVSPRQGSASAGACPDAAWLGAFGFQCPPEPPGIARNAHGKCASSGS